MFRYWKSHQLPKKSFLIKLNAFLKQLGSMNFLVSCPFGEREEILLEVTNENTECNVQTIGSFLFLGSFSSTCLSILSAQRQDFKTSSLANIVITVKNKHFLILI